LDTKMTEMTLKIRAWWLSQTSDRGASLVEYALLIVLIAIAGFVAVQIAGDTLSDTYHNISDNLTQARAS